MDQSYTIQSFIKYNLFIYLLFFFAQHTLYAQTAADTATAITSKDTTGSSPFHIGLHAATAYHQPLGSFSKNWNGYVTVGLYSDFATYISRMLFHFSVESGECAKKSPATERISIFHSSLAISYAFPIYSHFSIRPRIGLLTTTIFPNRIPDLFNSNMSIYADTESEFGVTGGVEPVFRIKRFRLGAPIAYNITFSSPSQLTTLKMALTAGAVF